jgi:CBS domain containing-hemolysin-like protein
MEDTDSLTQRFLSVARHAVSKFWTGRSWIGAALIELLVLGQAVFATYAAGHVVGLTPRDFSLTDSDGFLRSVLVWYLLVAVLVFPLALLFEVVFAWVRHLFVMRKLSE